ncbi:MAG: hypothetical protein JO209_06815 [Acidisphaera sp.]|nr:hypothetical protein [Acidisphaera sp.]
MNRILLDQNVPYPIRTLFPDREVKTAYQMGWNALGNGELLRAAEAEDFAVMVTCDQNIRHQQNMATRRVGLVVLSTNNWNILRDRADDIRRSVEELAPNGYAYVECGLAPKRRRTGPELEM